MDILDYKLKKIFPNLIVNKKYANMSEVKRLPRFISEYLIMKFTDNEKLNYERLQKFLKEYYIHPEEKNRFLYELRKEGVKEIIDEFYVEMRIAYISKEGIPIAKNILPGLSIPSLGINNAWIKESVLRENKDLLRGGVWGIGRIEIPRKVFFSGPLILGLEEKDNFILKYLGSLKNIFTKILKESEFEVIEMDPNNPIFLFNIKDIIEKSKEETGLIRKEDLNNEVLIKLCYELLINYIFKLLLIYRKDEGSTILQINYFSLLDKKWKTYENKSNFNFLKEDEEKIQIFFTNSIIKFLEKEKITPGSLITLTKFNPYQVSSLVVNFIISNRKSFNTEEWKEVLIRSLGLNPKIYNKKQKLLILTRLVPLVENNVNLIELGPKATGKTYIYRNASFYTRIFAGGKVSPAQIFYHGTYKIPGEIVKKDCIVFDELSKVNFDTEMISKLKDYMVDGYFERLGLKRAHSECSLVFIDNIDIEYDLEDIYTYVIPSILKDTAFLDRIHAFINGRELPKIEQTEIHLAQSYGLTADTICEFFHQLREKNFLEIVNEKVKLIGDQITIRDEKGIKKIICGLSKLLFPDANLEEKDLIDIIGLAIELRQNVNRILHSLEPAEFKYKKIDFRIENIK